MIIIEENNDGSHRSKKYVQDKAVNIAKQLKDFVVNSHSLASGLFDGDETHLNT